MNIVFLLSLPRSGSTLLQRLLAGHPEVATVSEPWVMLPLIASVRRDLVQAEYNHHQAMNALDDIIATSDLDHLVLEQELRDLALNLYRHIAPQGMTWFLDKTPRYHMICHDLIRIFPEARFIRLWRNPVHVADSIVRTFGNGSWIIPSWEHFLRIGISNLTTLGPSSRILDIRYEDLLANSEDRLKEIFDFLDLADSRHRGTDLASVQLTGRYGDHGPLQGLDTVVKGRANQGSSAALAMSSVRISWVVQFVHWIGPDRLRFMGYEIDELLAELVSIQRMNLALEIDDRYRAIRVLVKRVAMRRLGRIDGVPGLWS